MESIKMRIEQIRVGANGYASQFRHVETQKSAFHDFINGAKWADEHPDELGIAQKFGLAYDLNGHLVTGAQMNEDQKRYTKHIKGKWIEKACKWLKNNMYEGTCEQILSKKPYPFMQDFINEFKKAMEE